MSQKYFDQNNLSSIDKRVKLKARVYKAYFQKRMLYGLN